MTRFFSIYAVFIRVKCVFIKSFWEIKVVFRKLIVEKKNDFGRSVKVLAIN